MFWWFLFGETFHGINHCNGKCSTNAFPWNWNFFPSPPATAHALTFTMKQKIYNRLWTWSRKHVTSLSLSIRSFWLIKILLTQPSYRRRIDVGRIPPESFALIRLKYKMWRKRKKQKSTSSNSRLNFRILFIPQRSSIVFVPCDYRKPIKREPHSVGACGLWDEREDKGKLRERHQLSAYLWRSTWWHWTLSVHRR